jgi:hypothetical protein
MTDSANARMHEWNETQLFVHMHGGGQMSEGLGERSDELLVPC